MSASARDVRRDDPMRLVLGRLQLARPGFAGSRQQGVLARCPVRGHGRGNADRNPSLAVTEGERGQVLLHCFAGCSIDDIVSALRLTMADLFPGEGSKDASELAGRAFDHSAAEDVCRNLRRQTTRASHCTAQYSYKDDQGKLVAEVHRWDNPRTFRPFVRDPDTGSWSTGSVPRVLYGRDAAKRVASNSDAVILVVEGERDADLVNDFADESWVAVTNAHGAEAWQPEHTQSLAAMHPRARVVVCSDTDKAGKDRTGRLVAVLRQAGLKVEIAWPRYGKDIAEHVEAGGTLNFCPDTGLLIDPMASIESDTLEAFEEVTDRPFTRLGRTFTRSELADLPAITPLIQDYLSTPATALLVGAYGTGKTALALAWACCIATGHPFVGKSVQQAKVLYIVGEGEYGMHRRIAAWETAWGVRVPDGVLTIMGKPAASMKSDATWNELAAYCEANGINVVFGDTVSALAPDMDEVRDAAGLVSHAATLSRRIDGTVVLLHHPGWSENAQGRARGGYQLEANIDEVLVLDATAKGSDQLVVTVKKEKDGPSGTKHYLRRLVVEIPAIDDDPVSTSVTIEAARLSDTAAPIKPRILAYLDQCGDLGASPREIANNTGADPSAGNFKTALRHLTEDQSIVRTGKTSRTRYFIAGQQPDQ